MRAGPLSRARPARGLPLVCRLFAAYLRRIGSVPGAYLPPLWSYGIALRGAAPGVP